MADQPFSLYPESAFPDSSEVNTELNQWRDRVPTWDFEASFFYRKFAHRLNWGPATVDGLDIALVAGFMHDWQEADDETTRREQERDKTTRGGITGAGGQALANINAQQAIHEQADRDPRYPKGLEGTALRAWAIANNMPLPEAPVYDASTVIPGRVDAGN